MGDTSIIRLPGLPHSIFSFASVRCFCILLLVVLMGCQRSPTPAIDILHQSFPDITPGETRRITFEHTGTLPVLITINAHEATVESKVSNQAGDTVNRAYFDFRRGVPIAQLVEVAGPGTQWQIDIVVHRATTNSNLVIEVTALPSEGRLDQKRIDAYRLYSESIQYMDSFAESIWRERMTGLEQSGHLFRETGLTRQQTWSAFMAAALAYFPLYDMDKVAPVSLALFEDAKTRKLNDIAVMALQLHGQSLLYGGIEQSDETSSDNIRQSIAVFNRAALFAREHGQEFQHAWALNNIGVAHYYLDEFEQAISMHTMGLTAGKSLEDPYLNNVITSNIAAAMQGQGEYENVIGLLANIASEQRASGQSMELAFSLDRLGNTYTRLYQFEKAIEAYAEALAIALGREDFEMAGFLSVSLGSAYFELGYLENALQYLDDAIRMLETRKGDFGLNAPHAIAARIFRLQGDFERMRSHRKKQGSYVASGSESAHYTFEKALDMLSSNDAAGASIIAELENSHTLAEQQHDESLMLLSQLYLCLMQSHDDVVCDTDQLQQQAEKFTKTAKPREELEVLRVLADVLVKKNSRDLAMEVLLDLLDEIQFYRTNLTGVMGAWYWQSRRDVFQRLMNLQIAMDMETGDGTDSLLLLNRLRNIGSGTARYDPKPASHASRQRIRALMARMDNAVSKEQRTDIERQLQFELLGIPGHNEQDQDSLSRQRLINIMASMPGDSVILTYYFSDNDVHAWLMDSGRVRLVRISDNDGLSEEINHVMENFRVVGVEPIENRLDSLGTRLLKPLLPHLKENIFFMTGGPLNGFPIDALRYAGTFVATNHTVVNLQSLDNIEDIFHDHIALDTQSKILLSGNPLPGNSGHSALPGSLSEIRAIREVFQASDVEVISGAQFTGHMIESDAFRSAQLVHIASHGELNMKYPELSRIVLSPDQASESGFLTPQDLTRANISAELVVLSACETSGLNRFQFDSNLGFVSGLLTGGSNNVIASLFPVSDQSTAAFMTSFYAELARSGRIGQSLAKTKRKYAATFPIEEWTAFQLHRR